MPTLFLIFIFFHCMKSLFFHSKKWTRRKLENVIVNKWNWLKCILKHEISNKKMKEKKKGKCLMWKRDHNLVILSTYTHNKCSIHSMFMLIFYFLFSQRGFFLSFMKIVLKKKTKKKDKINKISPVTYNEKLYTLGIT